MNEPLSHDSLTHVRISCIPLEIQPQVALNILYSDVLRQRAFEITLIYHPLTWRILRITAGHSSLRQKTDQLRRALSYFKVIQLTYGVASVCHGNFANARSRSHVRGLVKEKTLAE